MDRGMRMGKQKKKTSWCKERKWTVKKGVKGLEQGKKRTKDETSRKHGKT